MKYRVMRKHNTTGQVFEVGSFLCQGDALWTVTFFSSHKGFDAFTHWVEKGNKTFFGSAALNPNQIRISDPV